MPETKEWTLMFYFASDNRLDISIVSQLKALKAAGFHPEANVIAQFDPFTEGTPTHIFDVNLINKLKHHGAPNVGFAGDDSFVRNLIEDKLWGHEETRDNKQIRNAIRESLPAYTPPFPPNGRAITNGVDQELNPQLSLEAFLKFCGNKYPARHYMLFILGHGVVVGNDVFLFDEHADEHSLTLTALGTVLRNFTSEIESDGGKFELVGFHSCSVSSLEVAYELQGTAKYMLASQGTAFVGSWPYRQILIRVFNNLIRQGGMDEQVIKEMLIKISQYCLHNSTDFLLAGYPFDLCLCNLSKISEIKNSLERLARALILGLRTSHGTDLILLAHWKAQSFYQEMYTDLFDFCFCLKERIRVLPGPRCRTLEEMFAASDDVLKQLAKEQPAKTRRAGDPGVGERIIVAADFAGPEYQYSHGLSVYFPWSKPSEDSQVLSKYAGYRISEKEFATSWLNFLEVYFEATKRLPRQTEEPHFNPTEEQKLKEDKMSLVYSIYSDGGSRGSQDGLAGPKTDPKDPTGGDCTCPSIKNYPRDIRDRRSRSKQALGPLPVGRTFLSDV